MTTDVPAAVAILQSTPYFHAIHFPVSLAG